MPLQTSRYLMAFASVILCICGLTLVDQLPGISLNLKKVPPVRRAPERTAHVLQPLPPAEPRWDPTMVEPVVMDYPDMYQTQQHQQVTAYPVSYQTPAEPVADMNWAPELVAPGEERPYSQEHALPQEHALSQEQPLPEEWIAEPEPAAIASATFDDSDFSEFNDSMLEVPAIEPAPAVVPPVLPPPEPDPVIPAELESNDSVLGVGSSEPFELEEPATTSVSLMDVPQELVPPKLPARPILPAVADNPQMVGDVMVLGFVAPQESTSSREQPVSRVVEGSYRIRKVASEPAVPSRIQGTFRFGGPPVEIAPARAKDPAARPIRRCQHHLRAGQKVCPHCGVIHN